MARGSYCPGCFEKQRKIDQLLEENENLKQKLRYQERKAQEGFFGLKFKCSVNNLNRAQNASPRVPRPGTKEQAGKDSKNWKPTR